MTEQTKSILLDLRKQKKKLIKELNAIRTEIDKLWTGRNDYEFLQALKESPLSQQEGEIITKIQNIYFKEHTIKLGFNIVQKGMI